MRPWVNEVVNIVDARRNRSDFQTYEPSHEMLKDRTKVKYYINTASTKISESYIVDIVDGFRQRRLRFDTITIFNVLRPVILTNTRIGTIIRRVLSSDV